MNSPFLAQNTATIRAERRAHLAAAGHLACLAIIIAALLALAHIGLATALAIPEIAAQAAALKGM